MAAQMDQTVGAVELPLAGSAFTIFTRTLAESDPEIAEAATIEKRLRHSISEGGYLILTVEPSQLERARAELAARFDLDACDLDGLFLESLRAESDRIGASWDVVLAADARPHDSTDWTNLQRLVERALPGIEGRLRSGQSRRPGAR